MKLNRKSQYGMLLVLYICRAGRTTIDHAAENLGLSASFMEQVARKLRLAGVLQSVRGPGGGYELAGEPTVADVLDALSPINFLTTAEQQEYRRGHAEHRAFAAYAGNLKKALNPLLNRTLRNINQELVVNELALMERPTSPTQVS